MPTPALTPADYFIGKAQVGYRAVAGTGEYTRLFTIEDTVARINPGAELFDPSLEFDLGGPVAGFQYQATIGGVQVECSLPQLDAATLALLIPGSTSSVRPTTTTGGGGSSTLSAATLAGATQIDVALATNFAVGDYVKIDVSTLIEYRRILAITGTTLKFFQPLVFPHASGVAAVETDGDGKTVIVPPAPGRVSLSAFKEFRVIWQRPDASWADLVIYRTLVDVGESPIELTTGNRTMGRVRATFNGYRNPDDPDAAPFALER